jgi:hypothetical protein
MENEPKKAATPPYVAYRTLKNFLAKFQQGTPGRIERGLMGNLSGAVQSQLTTALKYLGFVSDNNVPTPMMKKFVMTPEAEQTSMLKALLTDTYPFIFGNMLEFDFSTATGKMLRERFEEHTSATGETITRCMAFLKDAAQDAGIAVSPFLRGSNGATKKKSTPSQRRDRVTEQSSTLGPTPTNNNAGSGANQSPIEAQSSLLLWGLFQRLPRPGSVWPKEERTQWTDTLNNVLALEYKEK